MRARAAGWFVILGIVASTVESGGAQPAVTGVFNAASFDTAVPRGCVISIFGTRLARAKASTDLAPLPNKLEDAMVLVGEQFGTVQLRYRRQEPAEAGAQNGAREGASVISFEIV